MIIFDSRRPCIPLEWSSTGRSHPFTASVYNFDIGRGQDDTPMSTPMPFTSFEEAKNYCRWWHEKNSEYASRYREHIKYTAILDGKEHDALVLCSDQHALITFYDADGGLSINVDGAGDYDAILMSPSQRAGMLHLDRYLEIKEYPDTLSIVRPLGLKSGSNWVCHESMK